MTSRMDNVRQNLENVISSGAGGVALFNRGGLLIESRIKEVRAAETFAAMCATMFGAAEVACGELGLGAPGELHVRGPGYVLVLLGLSDANRLVAHVPDGTSADEVRAAMIKALENLSGMS